MKVYDHRQELQVDSREAWGMIGFGFHRLRSVPLIVLVIFLVFLSNLWGPIGY